jgi:hypothetical protein
LAQALAIFGRKFRLGQALEHHVYAIMSFYFSHLFFSVDDGIQCSLLHFPLHHSAGGLFGNFSCSSPCPNPTQSYNFLDIELGPICRLRVQLKFGLGLFYASLAQHRPCAAS